MGAATASIGPNAAPERTASRMPRLDQLQFPLHFEPRPAAGSPDGTFVAQGRGYAIALDGAGVAFAAGGGQATAAGRLQLSFAGANPQPRLKGLEPQAGRSHYLQGGDARGWRVNVPHYGRVRYEDVYPGVDVDFYGHEGELEYDIVLAPGGDPRALALAVEGAEQLQIDAQGDLVIVSRGVQLRQLQPVVYQLEGDGSRRVPARYVLKDGNRVGFEIDAYDVERPLYIDPIIRFSSYLGGSAYSEGATSVRLDSAGYIYIAGTTGSPDFPVRNGVQLNYAGGRDIFVTKVTPDGSSIVYSTYLGGSGDEYLGKIAVDAAGQVFIVGNTTSTNFPTQTSFQPTPHSNISFYSPEAFVTKLDVSGAALVFSTYLGGSASDSANGVAVDNAGNVRVVGRTSSFDFPGSSSYYYDPGQAFLATFAGDGTFGGSRL